VSIVALGAILLGIAVAKAKEFNSVQGMFPIAIRLLFPYSLLINTILALPLI